MEFTDIARRESNSDILNKEKSMYISAECEFESKFKNGVSYDLSKFIELLKENISALKKVIEENKPLEIICKFEDGQRMDMFREYKSFEEIIDDIPEI